MDQKSFINEQEMPKKGSGSKRKELTSEQIRIRDGRKGNRRSAEEKNKTKIKNNQYINEYNKKHYVKTVLALPLEERALIETLSKLSGKNLTQYVISLLRKDQENYDTDEFRMIFDEKLKKYSDKYKNDKPLTSVLKQETEKEKEEIIREIIERARQYFGKDPFTVSKTVRARYIIKETSQSDKEGMIQTFCNALEVSRAWYYKILKDTEK